MQRKNHNEYRPSQKVLENYADVLVNFALGGGKGIRKGDTVYLSVPEYAKPLLIELRKAVFAAGGNIILNYKPNNYGRDNQDRDFYLLASDKQINHFSRKYYRGLVDEVDHVMFILCETDLHALEGIDPKKIMQHERAFKPFKDWRFEKEHQGKLTWTIALYGTPAMAAEAGLSHKEYWEQIIKACFLDAKNPINEWKKTFKRLETYKRRLNRLPIEKLHIVGPDADLWISLGEKRQWRSGSGANIPSFEIFTSPDWRGTEGWIRFNQPLYRYGVLVEGIELVFKKGRVVESSARKNYKVLHEMIKSPNADKIGEFSLTDGQMSRITKFMAETLFDENIGGPQGNTHIALGSAYSDCYTGDVSTLTKQDKVKLGFNDSAVHTDIISTAPRRVMAYFKDGSQKLIYENGMFTV